MVILKELKEAIEKQARSIDSLRYEICQLQEKIDTFENKEHIVTVSINNEPAGRFTSPVAHRLKAS